MKQKKKEVHKATKLFEKLNNDANLMKSLEMFLEAYKEQNQKNTTPKIPISIFSNRKLGVLEIVVKYLIENHSLTYSKIAVMLNRDDRTIWTAYKNAKIKSEEKIIIKEEKYAVPCDIFSNRVAGPLEILTIYLRDDLDLAFKDISGLLNRNYQTIWLSYQNGKKKKNLKSNKETVDENSKTKI